MRNASDLISKTGFIQCAATGPYKLECIVWPFSKDRDGYGWLSVAGQKRAHRVSYLIAFGAIPYGKQILHTCDNPSCVNPMHLFNGTQKENMRDMSNKGRNAFKDMDHICNAGDKHPRRILSSLAVKDIRLLYLKGFTQSEIAGLCGLSRQAISDIVRNVTWKETS